jgi:transcriptional regulator with XRE-family HTH domain
MKNKFGLFVNKKRTEKQITLRTFSRMIGISPEYLSKIENNLRAAPKDAVVRKISQALLLSDEDQEILFDLAALSKTYPTVAADLVEYIMENEKVHQILRLFKRLNISDDDFKLIIDMLKEKYL